MAKVNVWLVKRKLKKGFSYAVQWKDPNTGVRKTEGCGTDKAYAQQQVVKRRQELLDGAYREITPKTWKEFCTEHLENLKLCGTKGNYHVHKTTLKQFEAICKPKLMTSISFSMLQKFKGKRISQGVAPTTINKNLRTLSSAFGMAVLYGYIKQNPLKGLKSKIWMDEPEKPVITINDGEFDKVYDACHSDRWTAISCIAYYAGLRAGEIFALEWKDIDFDEDLIHVRNKPFHRTKNGKERTIPMSEHIKAELKKLKRGVPNVLIFRTYEGKPLGNNAWNDFNAIVLKAGLLNDEGKAKISLHNLRKSFGMNLANRGVSPKVLQELMGHSKLETTMRYYVNADMDEKRKAIKKLSMVA